MKFFVNMSDTRKHAFDVLAISGRFIFEFKLYG